jgi:hypothetical protein
MSDDIKINVGVNSSVKAGMDKVKSDVGTGMDRVTGKFQSSIDKIKNLFGTLGIALGAGALFAGFKSLLSSIGQIQDQADQVGFDTENFQKMTLVAEKSGIEANQLAASLSKLAKAQGEVGTDQKAQKAFESLGISIRQAISSKPEDLFEAIAKGYAKTGDVTPLFDLFGKGAVKLIPTLREIAKGFDEINVEGVISKEDLAKIEIMDEKLASIGHRLQAIAANGIILVSEGFEELKIIISGMWDGLTYGEAKLKALAEQSKNIAAPTIDYATAAELSPELAADAGKSLEAMSDAEQQLSAEERSNSEKLKEYDIGNANEVADMKIKADAARFDAERKHQSALFQADIDHEEEMKKLAEDDKKRNFEIEKIQDDAAKKVMQDRIDEMQAKKAGIQAAAELQNRKDEDRKEKLNEILQKQGKIANSLIGDADTNQSWQAALARDRKAKSDSERGGRQVAQAQARIDKGVGTARDFALIGGMDAQREAKAARDELIKMDKDAKKAARETADNTAKMEKNIDALAKQINNIAKG